MATPSSSPFPLTEDPVIDATTHGYYWQLDASRTIKWSLADGFWTEYWVNPPVTAAIIDTVFDTISYYANIHFQYIGHYSDPYAAYLGGSDITISVGGTGIFGLNTSTWARAFFPDASNNFLWYAGAPGDIFLNVNSLANYLPTYEPGSAGYFLVIHEIGHALGLKHPHDSGGTGRPTLQSLGFEAADEDWVTVMSYNDDYNYNLRYWDPATPMLLDVLALQYLYGKNMSTNAGTNVYTLPVNQFYVTIWDASGDDWIDVSQSSTGWVIQLPLYQASTLVDTKAGYAAPIDEFLYLSAPRTFYWLTGDIENVVGSAYMDMIGGSVLPNYIDGGSGNDTVLADAGNDYVLGGLGDDFVAGNADQDTVRGGDGVDNVQGNRGHDIIYGDGGNDFLVAGGPGIDWVFGGEGNDNVQGNADDDYVFGEGGNDSVFGGHGNDSLFGDSGSDTLDGITGFDSLLGGDGNDVMVGGSDTIGDIVFGQAGNDSVLGGPGNDFVAGNFDNDTVRGGDGSDNAQGNPGNDSVMGEGGNDAMVSGGPGHDTVLGGDGNDNAQGNLDNDWIYGGNGDDSVFGGPGNDQMFGDTGNDTLMGGLGVDTISGGLDADRFWFNSSGAGFNTDVVTDFAAGTDKLQLDPTVFTSLALLGATLPTANFLSGAGVVSATSATQFVIYNSATGALYYDSDATGTSVPALVATFTGAPSIAAADIFIA